MQWASSAVLLALALLLSVAKWEWAAAQDAIPSSAGNSDAFVEAGVDQDTPWLGQQLVYVFRYYEAIDGAQLPSWIRPPDYEAPEFAGFWVEGAPETAAMLEERNGRIYNVAELRTILFPTTPGQVTISPGRLILYDLLRSTERVLETEPVTITVRPLPAGAPAGFTSAVGDFRLTIQADRTTVPVGEPILLRLALNGSGNLRLLEPPRMRELPGWRLLDQGSDVLTEVSDGVAGGTRTFDYMLIPGEAGRVALPPIPLDYFDPAAGEYRLAQTQPLVLTAEEASPALSPPAAALTVTTASGAPADAPPDAAVPTLDTQAAEPLAQIKLASGFEAPSLRPLPARLPMARDPFAQDVRYWLLWLLPALAVVIGFGAWQQQRKPALARHGEREDARLRSRAAADALRSMASPASFASAVEAFDAARQALIHYLTRKLGEPVAGLTGPALMALLAGRGASPELVAWVGDCLRVGDQARFGPLLIDWSAAEEMHSGVAAAIREMEKVLR